MYQLCVAVQLPGLCRKIISIDVSHMHYTSETNPPPPKALWNWYLFSSPEPKAQGELIVYQSSRRLSVCLAGCVSTFSNSNISATSGPIVTKVYLNHHWGGGKAALGFGPDRIGTLVSMATDSSRRVIIGKML